MVRSDSSRIGTSARVSAAVGTIGGPRDGAAIEIQPDAIAVVHEFLAINNLPADSAFIFQTGYLCRFARLPVAFGNHASAVTAHVFRIGHFSPAARRLLQGS